MKRSILSPALLVLTVLAVILSVWGPEALATYTDRRRSEEHTSELQSPS